MKKSFTLIEILAVFFLLSIFSTLFVINGKDLLAFHRFQKGIGRVYNEFVFSKRMASIYGADITVSLFTKDGNLYFQRKSLDPIFAKDPKFLEEISIPAITKFSQNDAIQSHIEILLTSKGWIFPPSKLDFANTKKSATLLLTEGNITKPNTPKNSNDSTDR